MRFSLILGVISVSVMTMTGLAGPLDPPAGPIVSTMKTLDEVEPRIPIGPDTTPGDAECVYRITQPGSYYLIENLQGELGKHGIVIATEQVTLDLQGFGIIGPPGPRQGSFDGITVESELFNGGTIRDGVVRDWSGDGVDLRESLGGNYSVLLSNLHAYSNDGFGIVTDGTSTVVERCTASLNGDDGISNATATVDMCSAYMNGGFGISGRGSITNSVMSRNQGGGIELIAGMVEGCVAILNQGDGIEVGTGQVTGNVVISNTNTENTASGIRVSGLFAEVRDNYSVGNDFGIRVEDTGNIITGNKCSSNGVNWFIVAGNFYGPIIDRTAANPVGVFGNSASSTLGTTDPNANFSF